MRGRKSLKWQMEDADAGVFRKLVVDRAAYDPAVQVRTGAGGVHVWLRLNRDKLP